MNDKVPATVEWAHTDSGPAVRMIDQTRLPGELVMLTPPPDPLEFEFAVIENAQRVSRMDEITRPEGRVA